MLLLVANNRGVRISGRRGLENLGQVCILVLKKIACFLLQIRLVYSLKNSSHFKYNKEVIRFHLLSFFHSSLFVVKICHYAISEWKKQC